MYARYDRRTGEQHRLVDHLESVAARCAAMTAKWGAPNTGHLAGLWHDLGKYQPAWQAMLADARRESGYE